jgi:hypothetical protein
MKWNDWVLIGAGLVFGFVLGAIANSAMLPNKLLLGPEGRLQWETLLAFAAAAATVFYTHRMISQTSDVEDDRRHRRERAARATLPLALTALCNYATECMTWAEKILGCVDADGRLDKNRAQPIAIKWVVPNIPPEAVSVLKECVEYADDEAAEAMSTLMLHLQIHHTRLTYIVSDLRLDASERTVDAGNVDTALVDAAEVYGRCSTLLPFARGAGDGPFCPEAGDIQRALLHAQVSEITCEQAYEKAAHWHPTDYRDL